MPPEPPPLPATLAFDGLRLRSRSHTEPWKLTVAAREHGETVCEALILELPADTPEARGRYLRLKALTRALVTYVNAGGDRVELDQLVHTIQTLPWMLLSPSRFTYLRTHSHNGRVEHIWYDIIHEHYLVIDEDHEVQYLTPQEMQDAYT